MADFLLSYFTRASWIDKGTIKLTRIKDPSEDFDQHGRSIYLSHQSCWTIARKHQIIQESMEGIMEGVIESPCNVVLYKQQVMRLNQYYDNYYYGIHILDQDGTVKVGRGMNLSEDEYHVLLSNILARFAGEGSKSSGKKNQKMGSVLEKKKKISKPSSTQKTNNHHQPQGKTRKPIKKRSYEVEDSQATVTKKQAYEVEDSQKQAYEVEDSQKQAYEVEDSQDTDEEGEVLQKMKMKKLEIMKPNLQRKIPSLLLGLLRNKLMKWKTVRSTQMRRVKYCL